MIESANSPITRPPILADCSWPGNENAQSWPTYSIGLFNYLYQKEKH